MRFLKERPWWNSRIDTTENEDIGCFLIGCVPEIGCPLFILGLPIYCVVRLYQWLVAKLRART